MVDSPALATLRRFTLGLALMQAARPADDWPLFCATVKRIAQKCALTQ